MFKFFIFIAKISELHAAMGLCLLPKVKEIIKYQKECSGWYDEQLEGSSLERPVSPEEFEYNYDYYPVIFFSHDIMKRVRQTLLNNGIGPRRYFYPSLNTLPFLKAELKKTALYRKIFLRVFFVCHYFLVCERKKSRIFAAC